MLETAEGLLAEMAVEANALGLAYSGDPNTISEPVDAIDAMLEYFNPEGHLPRATPDEWLPTHDYCEIDSGLDDPETIQAAKDTLGFYIDEEHNSPAAPDFEQQFRAFLHNNDYSYSPATIKHLISSVLRL